MAYPPVLRRMRACNALLWAETGGSRLTMFSHQQQHRSVLPDQILPEAYRGQQCMAAAGVLSTCLGLGRA